MAGVRGGPRNLVPAEPGSSKERSNEACAELRGMPEAEWPDWIPATSMRPQGCNEPNCRESMGREAGDSNGCPDSQALLPCHTLPSVLLEQKEHAQSLADPAKVSIESANGWDQILSHRGPLRELSTVKHWAFGDGTVSLLELLTGLNFQVYVGVHVWAVLALIFWCTWRLAALCTSMYILQMFGITGGFHRLLSHRSYKTSRVFQFAMAWLGCSAFQKGPLWWCSHHRHHHRTADGPEDAHSPIQHGFWWSHVGWFLCSTHSVEARLAAVPDLVRWPELRWLDKYHFIPPFALALTLYIVGGWRAVGWGFMLSTVLCWHATYCINSLAHLVGSRRYSCEFRTHCDARNNAWLAVATLGEGWHNNHHCYMRSAKHGFYPHELDVTYAILSGLAVLGLVWDLEMPPLRELEKKRLGQDSFECRCKKVEEDLQQVENE